MIFIIRNFGGSGGKLVFLLYLYLFYRPCYTGTPNTSPRPVPPAVFPPPSLSVYPRYVCTKYTIGTSVLSIPLIHLFSVYPRYVCTQYKIKKYAGGIHLLDILICRGIHPLHMGGGVGDTPPWYARGIHLDVQGEYTPWYLDMQGEYPPPWYAVKYTSLIGGGYIPLICGGKYISLICKEGGGGIHLFNMQGW